MAGPLAPTVDPQLHATPHFNAKSHISRRGQVPPNTTNDTYLVAAIDTTTHHAVMSLRY